MTQWDEHDHGGDRELAGDRSALDPTEAVEDLLRSLKTDTEGLGSREAQWRLAHYCPNQTPAPGGCELAARAGTAAHAPAGAGAAVAALLSFIVGSITVAVAVVLIIVLNVAVGFVQERHAENAVEALGRGVHPPASTVA